jgi:para-nitrobenzyl esterase
MKRFLALPLILFCTCTMAQTTDLKIVRTDAGEIAGSVNGDASVHIFKGIPFAAPPLGSLRWK